MQPSKPATSSCPNTSSLSAPANVRTALVNAFQPPARFLISRQNHARQSPPQQRRRTPFLLQPQQNSRPGRLSCRRHPARPLRHTVQSLPQKRPAPHYPDPRLGKPAARILQKTPVPSFKKYHGDELNISVCNSAASNFPHSISISAPKPTIRPAISHYSPATALSAATSTIC